MQPYWASLHRNRASRRRLLGGAIAVTATSMLVACSGSSDTKGSSGTKESASTNEANSLLTKPQDVTKSGRAGGTYKSFVGADASGFDPILNTTVSRVGT